MRRVSSSMTHSPMPHTANAMRVTDRLSKLPVRFTVRRYMEKRNRKPSSRATAAPHFFHVGINIFLTSGEGYPLPFLL